MPKVGLKLWSTNTGVYAAEAERLHAAGECDYLELFVEPGSSGTLSCWRRLHDDCGIPFVIHNAHAARGFNLASAAAEARNLEIYAETRAFADGLEAEHVIFHGGIDGSVEETVRQLKALGEPRALVGRTSAFIGLTLTGSPLPLRCARLSPPGHTVLRGPRLLSPLSGLPKKGNCGASNKTNPKQHTGVVRLPSPPGEGDRGWGL